MKNVVTRALFLGCLLWGAAADAAEVDLGRVRRLIDSGRAAEAYALLEPHEADLAGEEEFDYLYGIAALDSGKPDKAMLIFDRVLSVNPNHAGAHLDLGRAYFALHNDEEARKEFEIVLSQNPPGNARSVVERYLAAIEERGKPRTTMLTAYAEAAVGRDNNVNASTSQTQIYVPALLATLTLSSTNVQTRSNYLSTAAGGEITRVINPDLKVFVGTDVSKRDNPDAASFNSGSIDAHAGMRYGEDASNFTLALQKGRFYLGGLPNRDSGGVTGQWQYAVNSLFQINLFGAYSLSRYVDPAYQPNDVNTAIAGASWTCMLDAEGGNVINTTIFAGNESQQNVRADGNKDFRGVRLAVQHALPGNLALYGSLGVQNGGYDKVNVAFAQLREDWQYDVAAGLNWRMAERWSIRPQLAWTRNQSNIPIYQYDRTDASMTLRWDFR
ncbi:tetratricopeptide repeat protein [mine drainage metagenome]|uniref:Tetratricopeptide repeat protein n=1 Tax=mine drainage metagenome TaxID=410659 RepID=A0A1J5PS89_9ZZZZ